MIESGLISISDICYKHKKTHNMLSYSADYIQGYVQRTCTLEL